MRFWIAITAIACASIVVLLFCMRPSPSVETTSPVVETPRETTYTEHPDIRVTSPTPGTTVGHTFVIQGTARGSWYFEASFPVSLRRGGEVLVRSYAQAHGDWMTTEFVPFSATLELPPSTEAGPALLVLMKDNPSGLPEHDDAFEVPVVIAP